MKILVVGDVHATDHWKKLFDKVKFLFDDGKIYEGTIAIVDFDGGGLCLNETSYDIQTDGMFYKHVPQSRVII